MEFDCPIEDFPEPGDYCARQDCANPDFLTKHCLGCDQIYCTEHFNKRVHSCPSSRGSTPHSTPTRRLGQKNCQYWNCKKKENEPFQCDECKLFFCHKHQHACEHNCPGFIKGRRFARLEKDLTVMQQHQQQQQHQQGEQTNGEVENGGGGDSTTTEVTHNGNISEDEAIVRALYLSMQEAESSGAGSPTFSPLDGPVECCKIL